MHETSVKLSDFRLYSIQKESPIKVKMTQKNTPYNFKDLNVK